jgi:branched-chain amino acid transport system ATP-binding protein
MIEDLSMGELQLKKLRKEFGGLVAVNDFDLEIEAGEIRGLIGPNGSGKTTLFNLISGFLPATSGGIMWRGNNITGKPTHKIVQQGITRTFQLTKLLTDMSALQNVVVACYRQSGAGFLEQFFGAKSMGGSEDRIEKKALDLLKLVDIESRKDELAGALPHGYQRALNIAIALATEPKLLLLDEPATGMNPVETEKLMGTIKMLRDEMGIAIFLVEHDMKSIMANCDKVTVMSFGVKIAEGTPEEVSRNEEVIEAYIGQ